MKIAFSFFLLIYSRCGAPASWAARHTIVCLDSVTVLLEFLTALLEYLDLFNRIVQSADFPTVKAL